jgi:hypothetical protein
MSDELTNEIENLKSDIKSHVFTYQSMDKQWRRCEESIDTHMKALNIRQCTTTAKDKRIKELEEANLALLATMSDMKAEKECDKGCDVCNPACGGFTAEPSNEEGGE